MGDNESSVMVRNIDRNITIDWDSLPQMPTAWTWVFGFATRLFFFAACGACIYLAASWWYSRSSEKARDSDASPSTARNLDC